MPRELVKLLNLELAWRRVKADISNRTVFIRHPYETKLVEIDLSGWLNSLYEAIQNDKYAPSPMLVCDVPKGKGFIRPGNYLLLEDRVVYAACVGACFSQIHKTLSWSQGSVDFSYQLSRDPNQPEWLKNQFIGWQKFREKSLERISDGISYVIMADISGFYENIDIRILLSDLKQINVPKEVTTQLSDCLNQWAQIGGRSIPQGNTPSHILAKLYLNSVDQNLQSKGYRHYRYVDDIRVFCRNDIEAKRALIDLTRLLRKRGLNLQSAKTEICQANDARNRIVGIQPVIDTVNRQFIDEINKVFGIGSPYTTLTQAEEMFVSNPEDTPTEIIRQLYKKNFIDSADNAFKKTLFHYLLKRLGNAKDKFAIGHCKELLNEHPEETATILDYFSSVNAISDVEGFIIKFLNSEKAVYSYQIYQIIEWLGNNFNQTSLQPSSDLLAVVRKFSFGKTQPSYLVSVCRKFLGDFGLAADLELLEDAYAEAKSSLEQSEIICSLRKLEKDRRNSFLARAERHSELNRRAVKLVKM